MIARRIGPDEVEKAWQLVAECGRVLSEQHGLHQWNPPYPLDQMRAESIDREIHLLDDPAPIATFTVGLTPLVAYTKQEFDLDRGALYLNRLAVHPTRWGQGVGKHCMREIEKRARALGVDRVRCDTVNADFLLGFYRGLGFVSTRGFVVRGFAVTCLEKELP
jgi:GNAT superfamily N-acetyltransferase